MFEEYLTDSKVFLSAGSEAQNGGQADDARRYFRASVFCTYSALEAFVNYIADSFEKADNLERHEIAYINDKRLIFDPGKGLTERTEFHSLEDKIRALLRRFAPELDLNAPIWSQFRQFKKFRDVLVHPKEYEDTLSAGDYLRRANLGLQSVIDIMNLLSKRIFGSPLRQKLLDLRPE